MANQRMGNESADGTILSARVQAPVDAVCRSVKQPSYQPLRYHTVERIRPCPPEYQSASPMRHPVEAVYFPSGQMDGQALADRKTVPFETYQAVKSAETVAAETVNQPVSPHSLKSMREGMTLGELFEA